jgi:hypothetical protein
MLKPSSVDLSQTDISSLVGYRQWTGSGEVLSDRHIRTFLERIMPVGERPFLSKVFFEFIKYFIVSGSVPDKLRDEVVRAYHAVENRIFGIFNNIDSRYSDDLGVEAQDMIMSLEREFSRRSVYKAMYKSDDAGQFERFKGQFELRWINEDGSDSDTVLNTSDMTVGSDILVVTDSSDILEIDNDAVWETDFSVVHMMCAIVTIREFAAATWYVGQGFYRVMSAVSPGKTMMNVIFRLRIETWEGGNYKDFGTKKDMQYSDGDWRDMNSWDSNSLAEYANGIDDCMVYMYNGEGDASAGGIEYVKPAIMIDKSTLRSKGFYEMTLRVPSTNVSNVYMYISRVTDDVMVTRQVFGFNVDRYGWYNRNSQFKENRAFWDFVFKVVPAAIV